MKDLPDINTQDLNKTISTSLTPDLEPCPHCGGKAALLCLGEGWLLRRFLFSVECQVCQTGTRAGNRSQVINIWNMRQSQR